MKRHKILAAEIRGSAQEMHRSKTKPFLQHSDPFIRGVNHCECVLGLPGSAVFIFIEAKVAADVLRNRQRHVSHEVLLQKLLNGHRPGGSAD
jgi:hypothetical protein